MNIIVCVKPVPDPEKYSRLKLDKKTKRLIRDGILSVINPSDKNAMEMALSLRDIHGGSVIVISMCPSFSAMQIKECLAMGADKGYILSDETFGGADTFSTSYTLMEGIKKTKISADLILGGSVSEDGATSQVISQLGEWMQLPHVNDVEHIAIDDSKAIVKKKIPNGYIDYQVELPAVFGVSKGANEPRMITGKGILSCRNKEVVVWSSEDIKADTAYLGLAGSPTQPGELMEPDNRRESVKIQGTPQEVADQIIDAIRKSGYQL